MRGEEPRRPGVEFSIFVGERVLILRVAAATADLDILLGLKEKRAPGTLVQLAAQAINDLVGGDVSGVDVKLLPQAVEPIIAIGLIGTLVERLEGNEHVADVGAATAGAIAADKCRDGLNRGIFQHHLRELLLLVAPWRES